MTDHANAPELPRFFIDHGMVHDRMTGKHLVGANYAGEQPETLLAVLHELENEVWAWKQSARALDAAALRRPGGGEAPTCVSCGGDDVSGHDEMCARDVPLARLEALAAKLIARARRADVESGGTVPSKYLRAIARELDAITKEQRSNG